MRRPWTLTERDVALQAPTPTLAFRRLAALGYERTYKAIAEYRRKHNVVRPKPTPTKPRLAQHTPGGGRTRAQNRALWRLAERRPTPAEYHRERAAILRGDHEG